MRIRAILLGVLLVAVSGVVVYLSVQWFVQRAGVGERTKTPRSVPKSEDLPPPKALMKRAKTSDSPRNAGLGGGKQPLSGFASARGEDEPKQAPVQVEPSTFALKGKWSSQTLLVLGQLRDGTARDLTSQAEFKSADASIAEVTQEGIVKPLSDGETTISVVVEAGDSSVAAEARVTVTDSQNDSVDFIHDVMPLVGRLGCNLPECHGSLKGKGGFNLSMFGAEPGDDYAALTKSAEGRRVNKVEPLKSLFLLKATVSIPHEGGERIQVGSPEYNMLALWVAQGALRGNEKEPEFVSVEVSPQEETLQKGETRQLLATAVFSDGTRKDVTGCARYSSSQGSVAVVDESGKVKTDDYGESVVVATYMRRSDLARIVVPQPLPFPFPEVPANNEIDELVFAKLRQLGIPPSELCSDDKFIRRVYLDVIGTLPTADEARAFLSDSEPQKRGNLIDGLLDRKEFVDFWALKWGDLLRIKSEYPHNLWPKAAQTYYRWLRESLAQNKPYDQFARELLTSSGSNFRRGAVNFFRAVPQKDPQTIAEGVALVFMGARVGCARCHGHPEESWGLEDDLGLAAFFAQMAYKETKEWKEEIVYVNPKQVLYHPVTREVVNPKFLGGEVVELDPQEDPRARFAQWLTSPENPWFARNVVNRIWFWLLGRGIVHEPDDLRPTNPPENPELLEYLEEELVGQNYDLKHVYRLILNSRTYQLSSKPNEWNQKDVAHFSRYQIKRLGAEQLLDAVSQVTETGETFSSIVPAPTITLPPGYWARQLSDANIEHPFLELFGRPARDTPYESERSREVSMRQVLYFINSSELQGKVANSPWIQRLVEEGKSDPEIIEEIYLAALSRLPKEEETQKLTDYMAQNKDSRLEAIQDLVWAILNTKEFMFNH